MGKDFMTELQDIQKRGTEKANVSTKYYAPPYIEKTRDPRERRSRSKTRQMQPQAFVKSDFEFDAESP